MGFIWYFINKWLLTYYSSLYGSARKSFHEDELKLTFVSCFPRIPILWNICLRPPWEIRSGWWQTSWTRTYIRNIYSNEFISRIPLNDEETKVKCHDLHQRRIHCSVLQVLVAGNYRWCWIQINRLRRTIRVIPQLSRPFPSQWTDKFVAVTGQGRSHQLERKTERNKLVGSGVILWTWWKAKRKLIRSLNRFTTFPHEQQRGFSADNPFSVDWPYLSDWTDHHTR